MLYVGARLPELSETFVYREILGLRSRGRQVAIASVHKPDSHAADITLGPLAAEAVVVYSAESFRSLPGALLRHPLLLVRSVVDALTADHPTPVSRAKHLVQAAMGIAAARRLRDRNITHVHAHMAHVPATVALYIARALGARFSFTGHAADLFVDRAALAFKLRRAAFVSCISHWHRGFYRSIVPLEQDRLPVIRCSVAMPDIIEGDIRELVTVARLVPKKGVDLLLRAFAAAKPDGWRLRVVGGGPEQARLEALAATLGITGQTIFMGARPHEQCLEAIRSAGIFALPCRTATNGDRDGIPVVLMEAMAAARPVIAGDLPSIRELVTDGAGLLVAPDDVTALADAIEKLAADASLRAAIGAKARERVAEEFTDEVNLARLEAAFDTAARA